MKLTELTDEPTNAGDPKQLARKAERDAVVVLEKENALRAVLSSEQGRTLLVMIFDICGYDEVYFQPNHGLMAQTAGRRDIARQIRDWIRQIRPDGLALWQLLDAAWQDFKYPVPEKARRRASIPVTKP